MNLRIWRRTFFVTFLFLVLNGSFTNGIIELFKPSTEAQSSASTDVRAQTRIAYNATMKIFEIVQNIIEENHDAVSEDTDAENLTDLHVMEAAIAEEVKVVNEDNLPVNLPTWNDDEKEQRAVRLIALLITKFLAYHDALQYSFYRNWVQPSNRDGWLNKAAYSAYLISYGILIEADVVILAIKELLKSLTKYAEHSEVVDRTFNEIGEQMEDFEKNILENSSILNKRQDDGTRGRGPELVVKEKHVKFLLHAFADMLYEHKTCNEDTVKSKIFQQTMDEAYRLQVFTDLLTKAQTIRNNTHTTLPVDYLQDTEHLLAYHMQTRTYLSPNEHNQLSDNIEQKPLRTDIINDKIVLTQREPTVGQPVVSEPTVRRSPRLEAQRQRRRMA